MLQYILCIVRIGPRHRTQSTPHSGASSSAGAVMQCCVALCYALARMPERPGGSGAAAALPDGIGRQSLTCQCVAVQKGMGTTIPF